MLNSVSQNSDGDQSPNIVGDGNQVLFNAKKRLANEANTLLAIVNLIPEVARKRGIGQGAEDYSKDIEKKIEVRFSEYKVLLKEQLSDLEVLYRGAYEEARRNSNLDEFQLEEAYNLLSKLSIKVLDEKDGNPVEGLEVLTQYFKEEFASSEGEAFSQQAIKYFLYRQLIECNVFPNNEDL